MKLASLKNDKRDGQLIVVDRKLNFAISVPEIANTLQNALDNWNKCKSQLQEIYHQLNNNPQLINAFPFNPNSVNSPLPRAYQWADASAYVNHVELVRKARGTTMPDNFWADPLMYQGGSDTFLGPTDPILVESYEWGIDFEAEIAIITGDVPMGIKSNQITDHIKLMMLVNDVSLRKLIPPELAKGFGFFHGKPSSSFSPVAITPDELGDAWQNYKVHLPIISKFNDNLFGQPNAGEDMTFNFAKLISHAAKTRSLSSGTIIGSGTVSNIDKSKGSSCLAEKRMLEILETGSPQTPFMQFGDKIRIEMFDKQGNSLFGAIEQIVEQYKPS